MELRQSEQRRPPPTSPEPPPWRLEGSRDQPEARPRPPWRTRGFWTVLILLLVLNYALGAAFAPGTERASVPYSFFRAQVQANNVAGVARGRNGADSRVGSGVPTAAAAVVPHATACRSPDSNSDTHAFNCNNAPPRSVCRESSLFTVSL